MLWMMWLMWLPASTIRHGRAKEPWDDVTGALSFYSNLLRFEGSPVGSGAAFSCFHKLDSRETKQGV
jgi:hypothetical protein